MNILHLKYAVEIARVGSLSQAAQNLFLAQPNLSRSIKELESDIGIKIFERSVKGMKITPDGEEFIGYAKEILNHIDHVDKIYKMGAAKNKNSLFLFQELVIFQKLLLNFQNLFLIRMLKYSIKKQIHKER